MEEHGLRRFLRSGAGGGWEAKDLKLRRMREGSNSRFRNLRSFAVCAAQDDGVELAPPILGVTSFIAPRFAAR